jgi:hypothetical protein
MEEGIPNIELFKATTPLEDNLRSTPEAKQKPLRRRHHLYLNFISPYFFPIKASPFSTQCPRFTIWTIRIVAFSVMACVIPPLLLQLPSETGEWGREGGALAVCLLVHIVFHLLMISMFVVAAYRAKNIFDGIEQQKSPEMAARFIKEEISRDVLYATCISSGEVKNGILNYEDLDETTQNDISRAIGSFMLCLTDPNQGITSFYSISECCFRFSIYLFAYYMLMIASFYCTRILFGTSWVFVFSPPAALSYFFLSIFVATYWKIRLTYAELVCEVRREFFYMDLENGGQPTLKSSPDWWRVELSKKPFEEIQFPEEVGDRDVKLRLRCFLSHFIVDRARRM